MKTAEVVVGAKYITRVGGARKSVEVIDGPHAAMTGAPYFNVKSCTTGKHMTRKGVQLWPIKTRAPEAKVETVLSTEDAAIKQSLKAYADAGDASRSAAAIHAAAVMGGGEPETALPDGSSLRIRIRTFGALKEPQIVFLSPTDRSCRAHNARLFRIASLVEEASPPSAQWLVSIERYGDRRSHIMIDLATEAELRAAIEVLATACEQVLLLAQRRAF